MTSENVVYTYAPDSCPAIRYHSVPRRRAGAADTLDDARSAYRADLTELLHVERSALPHVIEHVEAEVQGMWVRERVGAVHRDHGADRMLLQAVLAPGVAQDDLRTYVKEAIAGGAEPVVLLVEPDEPVGTVLDQMTPQDAVVVAYCDPAAEVGWTAIYGPGATGAEDMTRAPGDQALRHVPIDQLARTLGARQEVRVAAEVLPEAC
jgi:hypothetical protein